MPPAAKELAFNSAPVGAALFVHTLGAMVARTTEGHTFVDRDGKARKPKESVAQDWKAQVEIEAKGFA